MSALDWEALPADDASGLVTERARVLDRFYRSGEPQAPGSGLGLAIVGEICRAHLAQISLHDGERGGLKVRVSFIAD